MLYHDVKNWEHRHVLPILCIGINYGSGNRLVIQMAHEEVILPKFSQDAEINAQSMKKCNGKACLLAHALESDPLSIQSALKQMQLLEDDFQVSRLPGT